MESLNILPYFVTAVFKNIPLVFKSRHKLVFTWLVLHSAIGLGDFKLSSMARASGSSYITEWRFRRFLTASYWSVHFIITWLANEVIDSLPQPNDGVIFLIVDGSKKDKRSKKNPFSQKGKSHSKQGYFVGVKFCTLMISWGHYRIPIDYELIYPKNHKYYRNENYLFRKMLKRFTPPSWAKEVVILGDSAFASKDNMKLISDLGKKYSGRDIVLGYIFALAKTWKFEDDKSLSNFTKHLPHSNYRRNSIQGLTGKRQKSYWVYSKKVSLRHVGEVTILLSKKRRNAGPKNVKVIVTNLPHLSAKETLIGYQQRFLIEVLFRELKSGLGLGRQQVTKNEERVKNSIGCSLISYLLVLKLQHQDIPPNKSWSIFMLKERLRTRVIRHHFKHECEKESRKSA